METALHPHPFGRGGPDPPSGLPNGCRTALKTAPTQLRCSGSAVTELPGLSGQLYPQVAAASPHIPSQQVSDPTEHLHGTGVLVAKEPPQVLPATVEECAGALRLPGGVWGHLQFLVGRTRRRACRVGCLFLQQIQTWISSLLFCLWGRGACCRGQSGRNSWSHVLPKICHITQFLHQTVPPSSTAFPGGRKRRRPSCRNLFYPWRGPDQPHQAPPPALDSRTPHWIPLKAGGPHK